VGVLMKRLYIIILLLLSPCFAYSADVTINAADCSSTEIQHQITTHAVTGDITTINVPAGSCTWTGSVTIPAGKTIKLIGAGSDQTIVSYITTMLYNYADDARISGIKFVQLNSLTSSQMLKMYGTRWRIDHNIIEDKNSQAQASGVLLVGRYYTVTTLAAGDDFSNVGYTQDHAGHSFTATGTTPTNWTHGSILTPSGLYSHGIVAYAPQVSSLAIPYTGLIDNNTLISCKIGVDGTTILAKDEPLWSADSPIGAEGTRNAVYIENNKINETDKSSVIIDCSYGGSFVARYNDLYGSEVMTHSIQGLNRSCRSWEIYGNKIIYNSSMFGMMAWIRGGTGMFHNNIVTGPHASYTINFDNVRSGVGLGSVNMYWGPYPPTDSDDPGLCNGLSNWDGNDAVTTAVYGGTGTIGTGSVTTGDATGKVLTDSAQHWATNAFYKTTTNGIHTGADSGTVLTKAGGTNWSTGSLVGLYLRNTTDGSGCFVSSNTSTTATCTLAGGSDNTWQSGDAYSITEGIYVYNTSACTGAALSTCARSMIYANTGTVASHSTLSGGSKQIWEVGDTYKITDGWPCRDQIGRGKDAALFDRVTYAASTSEPAYLWNNRKSNGDNVDVWIGGTTDRWIQNNRDYYDYNASFDGTSGTGCGVLSRIQNGGDLYNSCTTGVGYWATAQSCSDVSALIGADTTKGGGRDPNASLSGTLYKCTAPNTWTASYTPVQYPHPLNQDAGVNYFLLTVTKAGTGSGTVTSSPSGIDYGVTPAASFEDGREVTLTATPAENDTVAWSGEGCSGSGTCVVTMSQARNVTATFTLGAPEVFSVNIINVGNVTTSPAAGPHDYASGATATTTKTVADNWTWAGWSGTCGCTGTGACAPTITAACTIIANGELTTSGLGYIRCGTGEFDCTHQYYTAEEVTLSTVCASGGRWVNPVYTGDCTGATCVLEMTADKSVGVSCTYIPAIGGAACAGCRF
jgi:hypothetical protein